MLKWHSFYIVVLSSVHYSGVSVLFCVIAGGPGDLHASCPRYDRKPKDKADCQCKWPSEQVAKESVWVRQCCWLLSACWWLKKWLLSILLQHSPTWYECCQLAGCQYVLDQQVVWVSSFHLFRSFDFLDVRNHAEEMNLQVLLCLTMICNKLMLFQNKLRNEVIQWLMQVMNSAYWRSNAYWLKR